MSLSAPNSKVEVTTYQTWLDATIKRLEAAGIATARLDALVLLEDAAAQDRAYLLAHPEQKINQSDLLLLSKKVAQRMRHTPLAYVRGRAYFYGRAFLVDPHTLVPRPESEALIELLKKLPLPTRARIVDVGSGSGCLGITAALELPGTVTILTDIDPDSLKIAARNAKQLGVPAKTHLGDLLSGLEGSFDVILANLPYVPLDYPINQAARFEPKQALFAGQDGLDVYREFWTQVGALEQKPAFILTEAFNFQHTTNQQLARRAGYKQSAALDFAQCFILEEKLQA